MQYKKTFPDKTLAFTMVEVLITLGIIGIVASMTLPSLIGTWKDKQFKTAYKKAYSDISQAFEEALFEQTLTRSTQYNTEATNLEFDIMKSKFKAITEKSLTVGKRAIRFAAAPVQAAMLMTGLI